jgi:hypothetical protein
MSHDSISMNFVGVTNISAKIALAAVGLLALVAARSQELPPNKFLPKITDRELYSEIICSATIVKTSIAGSPVLLEGKERSQRIAVARVDRVLKGALNQKVIEFRYYGWLPPAGAWEDLTPPIAFFRPGVRCVLFLNRRGPNLEVAIPVYAMEIEVSPQPPIQGESNASSDVTLANELVFAIQAAPQTIGRSADHYFSWVEELIGRRSIPLVEPFLNASDRLVRFQAAWWLSFRKLDAAVMQELRKTSEDQNVEEWARSGARGRLRDIADGRYIP